MVRIASVVQPSPRRLRRREARTEDILETAQRLLVRDGLESLTMQRLADELDFAPAAVYRYFASKDALLAELQRRTLLTIEGLHRARQASLDSWLESKGASPKAAALVRLVATADVYREFARTETERFQLFALTLNDPRERIKGEQARSTFDSATALLADLRDRIAAAAGRGALQAGEAMDRAILFWSSLHGLLVLKKLSRFDQRLFDIERLADRLMETLLRGFGATPAVLEEALTLSAAARRAAARSGGNK